MFFLSLRGRYDRSNLLKVHGLLRRSFLTPRNDGLELRVFVQRLNKDNKSASGESARKSHFMTVQSITPKEVMGLKIGARNQLIGKVTEIKKGDLMSFIRMTIPAESVMGSVITLESLNEMGIKEGDEVKVIVKAVNVLIMKE